MTGGLGAVVTKELLAAVGEAIHGHQWQCALARDLSVADRTMRRWSNGDSSIPDRLADELYTLLEAKKAKVSEVADCLSRIVEKVHCGGREV